MTTITSDVVNVPSAAQPIYDFLIDLNNLEKLMPEGKYSDWESTNDTCRFNLNNMASIGMQVVDGNAPSSIHIKSHGKNPFDFTLDVSIEENGAACDCQLTFNGELNMMLKMMAVTPLTNFFNILAKNLVKQF